MERVLAKQLLLSSNYWVLNKDVVGMVGLEAAFLLSSFAEAENMIADSDGWFYQTVDKTERITTLTRHKQDQAIKTLVGKGILEQRNKGMPMKRYFRINYEALATKFAKNPQTRLLKISELGCEKSATSKESNYKENNKEHIYTIFDHWNSKNIIKHRQLTLKLEGHINAKLKNYSVDEIKQATDNYHTVLTDDKYYWSYKWTLGEFLTRENGFEKFLDENKPLENYLSSKAKDKPKETSPPQNQLDPAILALYTGDK